MGPEDPAFAGSSYVAVQKYLHDLTDLERPSGRTTREGDRADQTLERGVPRRRQTVKLPRRAQHHHRARRRGATGTPGQHAIRRIRTGTFGTYYIAYSSSPSITEEMLDRMFVGAPPGNYDRILDFSTAVSGRPSSFPPSTSWRIHPRNPAQPRPPRNPYAQRAPPTGLPPRRTNRWASVGCAAGASASGPNHPTGIEPTFARMWHDQSGPVEG